MAALSRSTLSREMVIGMVLDATQTSLSSLCERLVATKSLRRCAELSARWQQSTRRAASKTSSLVSQTGVRPSAFPVPPSRQERVTWRTDAQQQIVIHIA